MDLTNARGDEFDEIHFETISSDGDASDGDANSEDMDVDELDDIMASVNIADEVIPHRALSGADVPSRQRWERCRRSCSAGEAGKARL